MWGDRQEFAHLKKGRVYNEGNRRYRTEGKGGEGAGRARGTTRQPDVKKRTQSPDWGEAVEREKRSKVLEWSSHTWTGSKRR